MTRFRYMAAANKLEHWQYQIRGLDAGNPCFRSGYQTKPEYGAWVGAPICPYALAEDTLIGSYNVFGFQATPNAALQEAWSAGHFFDISAAGVHWTWKSNWDDNRRLISLFAPGWE